MRIETRSDRSLFCFLIHAFLKPFRGHLAAPSKVLDAGSNRIDVHRKVLNAFQVQERQQDGIYVYDITSKRLSKSTLRLYYFAGGGWQMPPSSQHWRFCAELAEQVPGLTVSIVSAPCAPNSPAADSLPRLHVFCDSVIRQGKSAGERTIFGGDSSGGNLALSLGLTCAIRNVPAPDALLAICPAVDLRRMVNEGHIKYVSKKDPILKIDGHNHEADNWARDMDRSDPSISPVTADMRLLADHDIQIIGVTAGYDVLAPDALQLRDKCEKSGVRGAWLHWEKQMHCFPLTFMYRISEGIASKDWIIEELNNI